MSLAGFLLFFDPPKAEATQTSTISRPRRTGQGDHRGQPLRSRPCRGTVGLDPKAMLTGEAIAGCGTNRSGISLHAPISSSRSTHNRKERIVRALQRTGHTVGYLGDGINDAPALHAADVGISVDQAVDVARESADVVLLRPDLDVLRRGVDDGRRTFANTLKYISITTSANFGNMVSMALATPLLPFLPLAAKQILLNNFLSDLPSIAISTDSVDADRVDGPALERRGEVRRFMLVFGLISTAFDLLTFFVLLRVFDATIGFSDRVVRRLTANRTGGVAGAANARAGAAQHAQPACCCRRTLVVVCRNAHRSRSSDPLVRYLALCRYRHSPDGRRSLRSSLATLR